MRAARTARARAQALALLLLCLAVPARAEPAFDTRLTGRVFGAALAFAVPRLLDPAEPGQLALWGLHGITALDPGLRAVQQGREVRLFAGEREVALVAAPDRQDAAGWGRAAAVLNEAAFTNSAALRRAGQQALVQSFFDEMFSHLDPYSRYIPPAPAEAERDRLSVDASAGLGLTRVRGGVMVADVVPGGPGEDAGARVGDRILRIDGRRVANAGLARVQALLTGAEGTVVNAEVRGLDGEARTLRLALAFVPPETVSASRDGKLLMVRVSAFTSNTAERLSHAIEAGILGPQPPAAVVIDLRGNRGGLLRQAVNGVALFAEQGVIASTAGRDPAATHDWRIDGGGDLTHGMRLILLVDGRTASAAEIMAAGLADLGRAVVVGSATLGKGLVQTITRLPDGGELFVTWSRVLAPKGWPIQSLGVMPQVCTSLGDAALSAAMDALRAGRAPMAEAVSRTRAARAPLPMPEALALRRACPAAEGGDPDLAVARLLAEDPRAYGAALLR